MKAIFIASPLRGSMLQIEAIERRVTEWAAEWTGADAEMRTDYVRSQIKFERANLYRRNTELAERLCLEVSILGHAVFAPHIFCTRFLDDAVESERNAGIEIGKEWMKRADEVWVYRRAGLSVGMQHEIDFARSIGKLIHTPPGWLP